MGTMHWPVGGLISVVVQLILINWQLALAQSESESKLCGSPDEVISLDVADALQNVLEEMDEPVLGVLNVEFDACCSLQDGNSEVDPTGASSRIISLEQPINQILNGLGPADFECSELALNFRPFFAGQGEEDLSCCSTCRCYGDPVCRSFDGTKKTWVLCDARTPPGHQFYSPNHPEENDRERCRLTRAMCETQLDHAGNVCEYKASNDLGKNWNVAKKGSPCVPNATSPPARILMYEVPDEQFSLEVTHGERGVIIEALLELEEGQFLLKASTCAWESLTTNFIPTYFVRRPTEDIVWDIVDPNTNIAINIRCFGNKVMFVDENNETYYKTYRRRINVESVADPKKSRATSETSEGFCVTGMLNTQLASTSHTSGIEESGICLAGLENSTKLSIAKAMCENPALPQSGIPDCVESFCVSNFYPNYWTPSECKESFMTAIDAYNVSKIGWNFCKATLDVTDVFDYQECVDQWEQFGPLPTIDQYKSAQASCVILDIESMKNSPGECSSGVTIEHREGEVWVHDVFLPENLCSNTSMIRLDYCAFPGIFENPVRFVQRKPSISCKITNQCKSISGFSTLLGLTVPTAAPTPTPTESPTLSPFKLPTSSPTESPTQSPTDTVPTSFPVISPTPFPSILTTDAPVINPTLFPTINDDIDITFLPSPAPTPAIDPDSTPPTISVGCQPRLCGSISNYFSGQTGSFSSTFDSCCPGSYSSYQAECPSKVEEAIRYVGFENQHCGSTKANFGSCQDDDILVLHIFFSKGDETVCCQECMCYGDPRCYAFDGSYDEFVLCDGRDFPESVDDRCIVRRDTCSSQLDHEGNVCEWITGAPDLSDPDRQEEAENTYSIVKNGSPCRYNNKISSPATLKIYSTKSAVEDYFFELLGEQYDRGYLIGLNINSKYANWTFTSDECIAGGNWTSFLNSNDVPEDHLRKEIEGHEIIWHFTESSTNIEVKIRCTGNMYGGEYVATYFNVEEILEPSSNRSNTSGFCATGVLEEKQLATTDHTKQLMEEGFCTEWNKDLTHILLRDSMRHVLDRKSITVLGTKAAVAEFCEQQYSPRYSSIEKCFKRFMGAKTGDEFFDALCRAMTLDSTDESSCVERLEIWSAETSYLEALQRAREQYLENFSAICHISGAKDFSKYNFSTKIDSDSCRGGIEVQYKSSTGQWESYMGIPAKKAPCKGFNITFNYESHPELFENEIRLFQRHVPRTCSACSYITAVDVFAEFERWEGYL